MSRRHDNPHRSWRSAARHANDALWLSNPPWTVREPAPTPEQREGRACMACASSPAVMVPSGYLDGMQVFVCAGCRVVKARPSDRCTCKPDDGSYPECPYIDQCFDEWHRRTYPAPSQDNEARGPKYEWTQGGPE